MKSFSTVQDLLTAFETLHVSQLRDPRPLRCRLRKYFGPLLPLPLESLSVPIVLGWVNGIRAHSATQADGCLSALRTMLNKAIEWEMYKGVNVAQAIKRKRAPRRKRYVMRQERTPLIREIEREPLMLRVYFYMMYYCGPRPSELQRTKIEDVKLFQSGNSWTGVWIKPVTKNGDVQQVPVPSFVCALLAEYLGTLPAGQTTLFLNEQGRVPSFGWWHNQWREVRRRAGLADVQQRDLRRSCATDLTEYLDLVSISKGVLNHRDLNTTQIYVQPVNQRIVQAMDEHVANTREHLTHGGSYDCENDRRRHSVSSDEQRPSPRPIHEMPLRRREDDLLR